MKITTLLKLVTLVVMLSTTPFAKADTYDFIIIHMKNGDKVLVNTNENPKISFSNQKISIGTEQFLISGISKYTFGSPTQNIDNTTVDINGLISSNDGHVCILLANTKSTIKVFSVDGTILKTNVQIYNSRVADIDLSNYPAGVYLLSINGETIKIMKR